MGISKNVISIFYHEYYAHTLIFHTKLKFYDLHRMLGVALISV